MANARDDGDLVSEIVGHFTLLGICAIVAGHDVYNMGGRGSPRDGNGEDELDPDRTIRSPAIVRACEAIEQVIVPRARDLGGFSVRRALPAAGRQMVGPFIFFDQMGPAEFLIGTGIDVRPHPHIGLATVTYLFDGEIMHRDSLGSAVAIKPGELNLMSAGSGIVHSERTSAEQRAMGPRLFGIQAWAALPKSHEEGAPAFLHYDTGQLAADRRRR